METPLLVLQLNIIRVTQTRTIKWDSDFHDAWELNKPCAVLVTGLEDENSCGEHSCR
jgi:hypothetical protein